MSEKTNENGKISDVFTELSLNLDRIFLMTLEVNAFFDKPGLPSERDVMNIISQFGNIGTKLEIAIDSIVSSRNLVAEQQEGEMREIVG